MKRWGIALSVLVAATQAGCIRNDLYQEEACYMASSPDADTPACPSREAVAPSSLTSPLACDTIASVDQGPEVPDGGLSDAGATCCYLVTLQHYPYVCCQMSAGKTTAGFAWTLGAVVGLMWSRRRSLRHHHGAAGSSDPGGRSTHSAIASVNRSAEISVNDACSSYQATDLLALRDELLGLVRSVSGYAATWLSIRKAAPRGCKGRCS